MKDRGLVGILWLGKMPKRLYPTFVGRVDHLLLDMFDGRCVDCRFGMSLKFPFPEILSDAWISSMSVSIEGSVGGRSSNADKT